MVLTLSIQLGRKSITMTRFGVGAVLVLLALGLSQANGNIFERTFKKLHREPFDPINQNRDDTVQTLWIEQKLDHFDESETRTWQMRYMLNDVFFKTGGPMFICVGGEWTINKGPITEGHMYDMAKEHNGILFYTEHRYYGKSHPLPDLSIESLQFLHVKQALADLAHFIKTQKASYEGLSDSKVIIVGGSYSAAMVTWFKRIYPDMVAGGWASSAPLFAKVDFVEYKEIVGESITLMGGSGCYNRIQKGITEMEAMFANNRGSEVKALLKLCEPFDMYSDLDIWNLFNEISDTFAGVVQYHDAGRIEGACQKIMSESSDLVGVSKFLLSEFKERNSKCNNISYKLTMDTLSDTRYSNSSMRQWIFQTCNEYGYYQTSGSTSQPFGTKFPLTFYMTLCADLYGHQFSKSFIEARAAETNEYFGGLTPKVENVYFSHGQLDPWRAMGIQDEKQATIIPKHAHCKDLGSISIHDTSEMRASKERVAELVREWLQ